LVSALASRSGGVTIIAALSLVMGPLGPLVGVIWLRRTRKPWFWINLDRETQITPARPTMPMCENRSQSSRTEMARRSSTMSMTR
jgi:hypothetical protein